MIRVIAIDDEPLALQQLVTYINKVPFLELAAQCQSALEAIDVLNREPVDAIFCDIEFVKSLAAPPLIVFTTAYSEYAVEGFKVNAVDYLLKPFGLQDFMRAANRIKEQSSPRIGAEGESSIFVKTDYRMVKVSIPDIRYVEGMSEYLKLHLDSQPKPIITLLSMKNLEERLPQNFMRIHRSYIVNLDKVVEVNKNRVILDGDTSLPIGDSYREAFNRYIDTRFLGK